MPSQEKRGRRGRRRRGRRSKAKNKVDKKIAATPDNLAETAEMIAGPGEKPKEVEGPPIAKVDVLGNRLISTDVILLSLETKPGDHVRESLIDRDVEALQRLGYFAYVEPEVVPAEGGQVTLLYKVIENPVLREVRVEGATLLPIEELQKNIVVEPGNVLNVTQLKESLARINKLYQDKGYAFCGVLSPQQFDMDRQTGILTLRVAEPVLGEMRILGNDKTKAFVIRRQFEVRRGRVLKAEKLRRSLRNLVRLNFFDEVKPPRPILSEDLSIVDLEIEVSEQRTGQASAGGGYSSLNGLIGFIDVAERNFKGRGQTVRVKWEFGGQRSYQLDFVEPWFKGKPQSLGISLFSTRVNRAQFDNSFTTAQYEERRTGYALSSSWRIAKDTRLSLSFSSEQVRAQTNGLSPLPLALAVRDLNGDGVVAFDQQFITTGWVKDARDNPMAANEGYRYSVSVSTTGGLLKGPTGFNRYVFDIRKYMPIGRRAEKTKRAPWTLAFRTRFGFHSVFEGNLTFNDRFAIGGADSIRGYQDREFTGERFGLANLELRKHLSKVISVVAFADAGDAWGGTGVTKDIKVSQGFGLRLTTPIGPFRLDYGKGQGRSGRFHFGIGNQF
jgi:outer membrane protein insertion porin family